MIQTVGTLSAKNAFTCISYAVDNSPTLSEYDSSMGVIPWTCVAELRDKLAKNAWQLHYLRQWYCWGADNGYPSFSPDVAFELESFRIGGNAKGQAVLSLDDEQGPLDKLEVASLLDRLRAATKSGALSLDEQAAVWICVALGPNPIQAALLREEDVKVIHDEKTSGRFIQLDMPRMKKGDAERRSAFRRRQLTFEIGDVVLGLIEENRRRRDREGWNPDFAHPLFVRKRVSGVLAAGPMRRYAMHLTPQEFSLLLKQAIEKLGVISHRTNRSLVVTTRRLRYTYATRLVEEGASKREVSDLLDHSDLQNVQVYFDMKSDIVGPLDAALALALGPLAQSFMGKVVRAEAEAVRGGDPASRVAVLDPDADVMRPVGTCGQYALCNLLAPVACYTCDSFQPWINGPHHKVLDDLLRARERKQALGQDGRMVGLHDRTIFAVTDVIKRIEAIKEAI